MAYIYKPFVWLFRCNAISPSNSFVDKYFALLVVVLLIPYAVLQVLYIKNSTDSTVIAIVAISGLFAYLSIMGFVFTNFFCRKQYKSILEDLEDAEEELRHMGVEPEVPVKTHRLLFSLFLGIICLRVVPIMASWYPPGLDSNLRSFKDFLFYTLISNAGLLQHVVLVSLLKSSFSALNEELRRISVTIDDCPVSVVSYRLESVFRVHSFLHLIVSDINNHFFIYNFFGVAHKVIMCVLFMYTYLQSLSVNHFLLTFRQVNNLTIIILYFVVQTVMCHDCAKEANHTVLLAHRLLQPHTPHRLWQEVGFFSNLCVDNKVHFTVGGVFTLDRRLITKVAVLTLSYLIIAVQLQDVQLLTDQESPQPTALAVTNLSILGSSTLVYNDTELAI